VTNRLPSAAICGLREWLRSDRRLGLQHWAVAPTRPPAASAAASVPDRARARPTRAPAVNLVFSDNPDLPPPCDRELPRDEADRLLAEIDRDQVKSCTRCGLHETRNKTVFGVGHSRPRIVFVGEGPGADEDRQGEPFVGRAGQLLTRMIAAMTLTREQVYICNIVKCRPPGNRTPTEEETRTCSPFLLRQLAILRPEVIVALGRPAAQTLLATKTPIGRLRGQFHDFPPPELAHLGLPPTPLMPTFHPAYLLRSPGEKTKAWEDLQAVMRHLNIPIPARAERG